MKNNILPLPFNSPRVPAEKRIGPHRIKEMVTLFYNTNILAIALPSLRISPLLIIRIATIVLLCAAALSLSVVYIQSIGSGTVVFSRLFPFFSENDTLIGIYLNGNLMHCEIHQVPLVYLLLSSLLPVKPRLTKAEKEKLVLPENLQNILVGLLLGDLSGEKQALNARMRFKQSTIHEEYLLHLYNLFKTYCPGAPNKYNSLIINQSGKVNSSIWFHTYSLPCFEELYKLFYPEGKKVIPNNIGELLTPLGLCYWICDDGGFNKRNHAVVLSTQSFSLKEVNLLSNVLAEKFNLNCSVNKNENAYVIRISAKSLPILQSLLKNIMPPMMLYKLNL